MSLSHLQSYRRFCKRLNNPWIVPDQGLQGLQVLPAKNVDRKEPGLGMFF